MRGIMRAIGLVLLAGCASAKTGDTLSESIQSYNDGVRWERFGVAAIHVPPKERSSFVEEADARAHDIKITDYEVVNVNAKNDHEATVQVKLEWYNASENLVRETQSMQSWEKHGKTWWMVDETRFKGHEMPGLSEPRGAAGQPVQEALTKPQE